MLLLGKYFLRLIYERKIMSSCQIMPPGGSRRTIGPVITLALERKIEMERWTFGKCEIK